MESLRLDPLGVDSEGNTFWYFYGTRLYKEVKKKRKPREKKPKGDEEDKEGDKKKKKKKKAANEHKETSVEVGGEGEEDVGAGVEAPGWYVACQTESEWNALSTVLMKSKKKADKELAAIINDNFLPDVVKMFQEREREEQLKILMMNKRSSVRIDKKRQAQEEEEERQRIKQRRLMEVQQKEEEERRRTEKENKLKSREARAQMREEKLARVAGKTEDTSRGRADRLSQRELVKIASREEQRKLEVRRPAFAAGKISHYRLTLTNFFACSVASVALSLTFFLVSFRLFSYVMHKIVWKALDCHRRKY